MELAIMYLDSMVEMATQVCLRLHQVTRALFNSSKVIVYDFQSVISPA